MTLSPLDEIKGEIKGKGVNNNRNEQNIRRGG